MSRCIKEQLLISIHTPRVGSDWTPGPWKERRNISIHAPRVGSDSRYVQIHTCKLIELR